MSKIQINPIAKPLCPHGWYYEDSWESKTASGDKAITTKHRCIYCDGHRTERYNVRTGQYEIIG